MTASAVRLIFTKQPTVTSTLIRYMTWSRWSHVGILTAENTIVESMIGAGVREISLDGSHVHRGAYEVVSHPCPDPTAVAEAARAHIGKPYDLAAIVGFLGRSSWQKGDAWFCSELVAKAFGDAGYPLFRSDRIHRVTPEHLWMLAPKLQ